MSPGRWSVFIDIEGFSSIFKANSARALGLLAWLTRGLYLIAAHHPRKGEERLCVHQMGDGFVVVSDYPEPDLSRPISIAISLMQYLLGFQGWLVPGCQPAALLTCEGVYPLR